MKSSVEEDHVKWQSIRMNIVGHLPNCSMDLIRARKLANKSITWQSRETHRKWRNQMIPSLSFSLCMTHLDESIHEHNDHRINCSIESKRNPITQFPYSTIPVLLYSIRAFSHLVHYSLTHSPRKLKKKGTKQNKKKLKSAINWVNKTGTTPQTLWPAWNRSS